MIFIVKLFFNDQSHLQFRVSADSRESAKRLVAFRRGEPMGFPYWITVRKARDQRERISDMREWGDVPPHPQIDAFPQVPF